MKKFENFTGRVAALDRSNVDTDQIIPKQFLKRIERTGFGQFVFYDWRFDEQQQLRDEFELNRPENQDASILLARRDFGTGSSREHAVWAIEDFGFRVVIAESFGDIFYNNCFKNGLLPIRLDAQSIEQLFRLKETHPDLQLHVDLEACQLRSNVGFQGRFELDEFRRQNLLRGLDDIGLTLQHEEAITNYETRRGLV